MHQRGGQYSEATFSYTAQVIENNQNILNELKSFIVRKKLEKNNPRNANRQKAITVKCILFHPVTFATVSPFCRFLGFLFFLLLVMVTFMRGIRF